MTVFLTRHVGHGEKFVRSRTFGLLAKQLLEFALGRRKIALSKCSQAAIESRIRRGICKHEQHRRHSGANRANRA